MGEKNIVFMRNVKNMIYYLNCEAFKCHASLLQQSLLVIKTKKGQFYLYVLYYIYTIKILMRNIEKQTQK